MGIDWTGLLHWSSSFSDGSPAAPAAPRLRTPDEIRWFEEAVAFASQFSDFTRMRDLVSVLHRALGTSSAGATPAVVPEAGATGPSTDGQVCVLEDLLELVENSDNAKDFAKAGWIPVLLTAMRSLDPPARAASAEVLAALTQNNPDAQTRAAADGALPAVMAAVHGDGDGSVRVKSLLALASLVRGNDALTAAFRRSGGVLLLCDAVMGTDPREARKALQLLGYLVGLPEGGADAVEAAQMGLAMRIAPLLDPASDDLMTREAALVAIAQTASASDGARTALAGEPLAQALATLRESAAARAGKADALAAEEESLCDSALRALNTPVISLSAPGGLAPAPLMLCG